MPSCFRCETRIYFLLLTTFIVAILGFILQNLLFPTLCFRSWQFLYFPERVVKYIRVVGTHNTVNKVFHVVTLEALYTMTRYQLDMGLIVPTSNVATLDHSALVIEGKIAGPHPAAVLKFRKTNAKLS
jgi:hypothetical protein